MYERTIFSQRAKIYFEVRSRMDKLRSIEVFGTLVAQDIIPRPKGCDDPFQIRRIGVLDSRSGDSFCEDYFCVDRCKDGRSFGFLDEVEFAIVERDNDDQSGVDAFWSDKSLVEEPSFGTFVYNVSSFGFKSNETNWPADVVRLVGQVKDRSIVVVKESVDDRRFPGRFLLNETLLTDAWQDTGDVSFPRNGQTPFGDNEKTSAVSVLNGQVTFVWSEMQDALWTFANDRWQNQGNGGMTKLLRNASEPQPQRRLATINDNIVLVISAYQNAWHDGSVDAFKIARPVDQRVVDIYEIGVTGNRWSNEKLTHHVSDINRLRVERVDENLIVSFSFLF